MLSARLSIPFLCLVAGCLTGNTFAEDFVCGTDTEIEGENSILLKQSAANAIEGKIHVLVFRVAFKNMPYVLETSTLNTTHTRVIQYFKENSHDRVNMTFAIHPEVWTAPENGEYYASNWSAFTTFMTNKVKEAGLTKGRDWDRYIASFPKIGLSWSGLSRGISNGSNFTNGSYSSGLVAHELGHAVGLPHASALKAGKDIIGTPGTAGEKLEYGDRFDVMGSGGITGHFNTMYKKALGWMAPAEVTEVKTSGVYRIYAHDNPNRSGKSLALRIRSGDSKYHYWVEYRTSYSSTSYNARKGVGIRLEGYFASNSRSQTAQLDMTPGSLTSGTSTSRSNDFNDANLEVGKKYTDKFAGFSITPTAQGAGLWDHNGWMDVKIEIDGQVVAIQPQLRSQNILISGSPELARLISMGGLVDPNGRRIQSLSNNTSGMVFFSPSNIRGESPRIITLVK